MIPVAFVPKWGANYTIRIAAGTEIKRKWSDYSDGFAVGGAIFTYDETGGKRFVAVMAYLRENSIMLFPSIFSRITMKSAPSA